MSAGNGNTTPSSGMGAVPPPPTVLGDLTKKSDRELLELATRQSHHAWMTAAGAIEWVRELAESQDKRFVRIETRLGIVELAPRDGSHPALERIVGLHLDDEETAVRQRRHKLEADELDRKERAVNRAKAWALTWAMGWRVVLPLLVAIGGALAARSCF